MNNFKSILAILILSFGTQSAEFSALPDDVLSLITYELSLKDYAHLSECSKSINNCLEKDFCLINLSKKHSLHSFEIFKSLPPKDRLRLTVLHNDTCLHHNLTIYIGCGYVTLNRGEVKLKRMCSDIVLNIFGEKNQTTRPIPKSYFGDKKVLALTFSSHKIFAINVEGELYEYSKKRKGKIENIPKAKSIVCNKKNSFLIADNGDLFVWGENDDGILGLGHSEEITVPTKLDAFSQKEIISIALRAYFVLALTADGDVYFWMTNSENKYEFAQPTPIDFGQKKVIAISCSKKSGLALTETGEIYTFDTREQPEAKAPTLIIGPWEKNEIISICATDDEILTLDRDGKVYGWNENDIRQLDPDHPFDIIISNPMKFLKDKKIECIYSVKHVFVALSRDMDGYIYLWNDPLNILEIPKLNVDNYFDSEFMI